ncbi:hypothetical protein AMAG_20759, partial [Allomyces macrogynus ATCC 38327]
CSLMVWRLPITTASSRACCPSPARPPNSTNHCALPARKLARAFIAHGSFRDLGKGVRAPGRCLQQLAASINASGSTSTYVVHTFSRERISSLPAKCQQVTTLRYHPPRRHADQRAGPGRRVNARRVPAVAAQRDRYLGLPDSSAIEPIQDLGAIAPRVRQMALAAWPLRALLCCHVRS